MRRFHEDWGIGDFAVGERAAPQDSSVYRQLVESMFGALVPFREFDPELVFKAAREATRTVARLRVDLNAWSVAEAADKLGLTRDSVLLKRSRPTFIKMIACLRALSFARRTGMRQARDGHRYFVVQYGDVRALVAPLCEGVERHAGVGPDEVIERLMFNDPRNPAANAFREGDELWVPASFAFNHSVLEKFATVAITDAVYASIMHRLRGELARNVHESERTTGMLRVRFRRGDKRLAEVLRVLADVAQECGNNEGPEAELVLAISSIVWEEGV